MSTTISADQFRVLIADSVKAVEAKLGKLNEASHVKIISGIVRGLAARDILVDVTSPASEELPFAIRHTSPEEVHALAERISSSLRTKGYTGKLLDEELATALRTDLTRIERSLSIDAERRANLHVVPAE